MFYQTLKLAVCLAVITTASADPCISEFCASNQDGLEDQNGDHSDWIEIYNPDQTAVSLANWYLSDSAGNKTKWRFPDVTLPSNGYLVVFASSKDRRVPGSELHTNFALGAGGEYLGLTKPDGVTVASQYSPSFPAQVTDITYGIPTNMTETTFVAENTACQWIVPSSASFPAPTWKDLSFSPTGWTSATMGVGYDKDPIGTDYLALIGTNGNIQTPAASSTTCYIRVPFHVPAGSSITNLKLRVRYDDGLAVWLNGQPLLSGGSALKRMAPATLAWNSNATGSRPDSTSATYQDIDISENIPSLLAGNNVLAFQLMNTSAGSTDQLLQIQVTGDVGSSGPELTPGYFATATPGARNPGISGLVIPQLVTFSKSACTFSGTLGLVLSGATTGQVIRYTLDGSEPTASSPAYSSAISLTTSKLVRARIHETATGALGFISGSLYECLATDLSSYASTSAAFKSALPILVLNDNGAGEPANDNIYRDTRIQIFDRDATGYASLATASPPSQVLVAGAKLRGRSSSDFPKKSYGIEVRDEGGTGKEASILGMPSGEDWALVGGYNYDRASMRNALIYELSRQSGTWAPRTRLVEVFFNQDGDNLEYADYRGVYILCETARTGEDRVDIAKLDASDVAAPALTGGYIFKVDPPESDEYSWQTNRGYPPSDGAVLVIHRPKLDSLAPAQSSYLKNHFQLFENAVFSEASAGFTTRNYRNYIDSRSWVDYNLFCTLAKNVDALRLSAYFSKDRTGKMMAGPLWDFDRSIDSTDGRDDVATTWSGSWDATDYHTFAWWGPLFHDVEFCQLYVDRWQTMRRGPLDTANVNSILNGLLAQYKTLDPDNPSSRDHLKWYQSATASNVVSETNAMKSWLSTRSTWIDGQFATPPTISRASGPVTAGLTTTITVPPGTNVYYMTNGSDPRAEGGGFRPGAQIYSGPIALNATTLLVARAYRSGFHSLPPTNWSGPVEALYLVNEDYASAANLRVSAVNYNPLFPTTPELAAIPALDSADFEWIELQNVSEEPVNLHGVSFAKDSPVTGLVLPARTLAAGERALIAKNTAAFQLRYGATAASKIVATWSGHHSLDNGGGEILIRDRSGTTLANFNYDDEEEWPTRADGGGSVIEYIGNTSLQSDYQNPALWKSSVAVHGAPGSDPPVRSAVVVNEILASRAGAPDAIELLNTGTGVVDLGGWYLSNRASVVTETDYRQYRIPDGTLLPPGGYLVFDESNFNPSPASPAETDFQLDGARGGTVWLISGDSSTGKLLTFEQKEDYTPTIAGVPWGRSPDGCGDLLSLSSSTLGTTNGPPRVGSVQTTEIHFHPANSLPEYLEVANTSSTAEFLGGWTLRGEVDYDFPPSFSVAPGEGIVIVSFDPVVFPTLATAFREQYSVPAGVRLVGPWSSGDTLSNTTGTVRLRRRVPPPDDEPTSVGLMIEDEVNYLSSAPWPTGASGTGRSVHRLGIFRQASDPTAWTSGQLDPGTGLPGYPAWQLEYFPTCGAGTPSGDNDLDGLPNLMEYLLGSDPHTFTALSTSVDSSGAFTHFTLDYTLRTDHDDFSLSAEQSGNLDTWVPAENDAVIRSDGLLEQRRVSLPLEESGFLRLRASPKAKTP